MTPDVAPNRCGNQRTKLLTPEGGFQGEEWLLLKLHWQSSGCWCPAWLPLHISLRIHPPFKMASLNFHPTTYDSEDIDLLDLPSGGLHSNPTLCFLLPCCPSLLPEAIPFIAPCNKRPHTWPVSWSSPWHTHGTFPIDHARACRRDSRRHRLEADGSAHRPLLRLAGFCFVRSRS